MGISGDHNLSKPWPERLNVLRCLAVAAGFDVKLPDQLVRVEKVGQFRQLVEMSEASNDLKNKVRERPGAGQGPWIVQRPAGAHGQRGATCTEVVGRHSCGVVLLPCPARYRVPLRSPTAAAPRAQAVAREVGGGVPARAECRGARLPQPRVVVHAAAPGAAVPVQERGHHHGQPHG